MNRELMMVLWMLLGTFPILGCAEMLQMGGSSGGASAAPVAGTPVASASGRYQVTFGVTNGVGRLGALQFEARVKSGGWVGTGASVTCRNVSGAGMMACNNKGSGLLACALIDANGIATPKALVVCDLAAPSSVSAADIRLAVSDASGANLKPVNATVGVTKLTAK